MKFKILTAPNIIGLAKFALASLSSFAIDYILFSALCLWLPNTGRVIALANILARIVSATYNYLVNCCIVFRRRRKFKSAFHYFLLAISVLALNTVLVWCLTQLLFIPAYIAKLIAELVLFIVSFIVQKKIIFRKRDE